MVALGLDDDGGEGANESDCTNSLLATVGEEAIQELLHVWVASAELLDDVAQTSVGDGVPVSDLPNGRPLTRCKALNCSHRREAQGLGASEML